MAVRFKLLKDLFETGLMIAMDRQAGREQGLKTGSVNCALEKNGTERKNSGCSINCYPFKCL